MKGFALPAQGLGPSSVIGQKLGHYRVVEEIGAGGMGVVYRAHDEHLDREVAIKVLPRGALANTEMRKRFRNEAHALSKLNHPNIATIHDFDSAGDTDYLVMEYVPGEKLRDKIAAGPLVQSDLTTTGIQVADGLAAAHQRGVVHRDLKPENVRFTLDGRLKILDFGLAKLIRPVTDLPTTDSNISGVAGTLPYMSPEQLLGKAVDRRADLFSFGVVLYEMATGALPFTGNTPSAISDAILHGAPPAPVQLNPKLPPRLDEIIHKALEKDPELRYQHATDIRADLQRLRRDSGTEIPAVANGFQIRTRWKRLLPIAAFAVLLVVIAALAMVRARLNSPSTSTQLAPASIAVLPFADLSPEKNQEYFSDGLAEELINDLAKIQGLRVAARTSSFQFKGKSEDPRTMGEKLKVGTILEGSVRKDGNKVKITVQLISAATGFNLWSETYDRPSNDIFTVQEDIGRSVAASLKLTLLGGSSRPSPTQSRNPEAYDSYLQAQYFYERPNKENLEKAVACYKRAIELDAGDARWWAGLALVRSRQADMGQVPVETAYREARQAAERALALAPDLGQAHLAIGWIKARYDWDWTGADTSLKRALALEPGSARIMRAAAVMAAILGRFDEAVEIERNAVELDPLSASAYADLGIHAYYAGSLDEALAAFKKAADLNPDIPGAHTYLGRVCLARGRPNDALAEMEREQDPGWRLTGLALAYYSLGRRREADAALAELVAKYQADSAYQIAEVYAFRAENDQSFHWLERAYAQRDGGLTEMKGDPLLSNLVPDPRYAAFLKKMRLLV